jgi:hypothetical protein
VAAGNGLDLTDFYQFTVSTNAVRAQFETFGANGDIALLVRKGPSLDFPFVPDYSSSQSSTNNELIVVTAGSLPVPLSPGIWYLGVRNRTALPVFYQVVATEFFGMPSTNIIQATISGSSDIVCITWNSEVGTNYVVEGLTNLTDSTWTVVPPTITATETTTSFCLSLPNPLHYFRVRLETAPVQPTNSPINMRLFFTTNAICLSWNSQIGTNYYVQGKAELNTPAWTTLTTTITATATNTTNCISLPATNHFFRVVIGNAPSSVATLPTALTGETAFAMVTPLIPEFADFDFFAFSNTWQDDLTPSEANDSAGSPIQKPLLNPNQTVFPIPSTSATVTHEAEYEPAIKFSAEVKGKSAPASLSPGRNGWNHARFMAGTN